ncbi:MAG TPA: nuclear transport factor 2 family protein [Acidimicrobiia bacterium]|nr:nuclear transport factor 2 family protein [Acidimicrobiia bacterium]
MTTGPDVIAAYFAAVNQEDWGRLAALWCADAEFRAVGTRPRHGPADIVAFFEGLFTPWATHVDTPTRVLECGSSAAVEVRFTGTTRAGLDVAFDAVDIFDLRDGRIGRLSNWYDIALVRRLLAASPPAVTPPAVID